MTLQSAVLLHIAEYNIDQNGAGTSGVDEQGTQPQAELLSATIPQIDILGLIEIDRGCAASNYTDGPEYFGEKLGLNYSYYAVEFVKNFENNKSTCTTGNAVLSRYPMDSFKTVPFDQQCCSYSFRSGGRIMSIGHISNTHLGSSKGLYVIVLHLEAGGSDFLGISQGLYTREAQLLQLKAYIQSNIDPQQDNVIVFGDFNAPIIEEIKILAPTQHLNEIGFYDVFHDIPKQERTTVVNSPIGDCLFMAGYDFQLDYIFFRGKYSNQSQAGIVKNNVSTVISDHLPIFATVLQD